MSLVVPRFQAVRTPGKGWSVLDRRSRTKVLPVDDDHYWLSRRPAMLGAEDLNTKDRAVQSTQLPRPCAVLAGIRLARARIVDDEALLQLIVRRGAAQVAALTIGLGLPRQDINRVRQTAHDLKRRGLIRWNASCGWEATELGRRPKVTV